MPVREASEWPRVWVVTGQTLLDSVPTRFEIMWPLGRRADRTHTVSGTLQPIRLSQMVPLARPGRLSLLSL